MIHGTSNINEQHLWCTVKQHASFAHGLYVGLKTHETCDELSNYK